MQIEWSRCGKVLDVLGVAGIVTAVVILIVVLSRGTTDERAAGAKPQENDGPKPLVPAGTPKTEMPVPKQPSPKPVEKKPSPEPETPVEPLTHVLIASALQGKRGAEDVHLLARSFDAPMGDGRRGAVGVVLNSAGQWQKLGTRWAFRYARSGSAWGVQIIHPLKEGQVVICITRTGVAAATPHAWTEVGYGRGDPKRLTRTEDFGEVFPLDQDRFAAFVSALLPDGSYELQMNGRVIVRGRFESARPISFAIEEGKKFPGASGWAKLEFKGHQFPEQWEAGYAGILVEPLDDGQNTVRDLHFSPGIARLTTDPDRQF